ncbi:hypothetical protein D3C71_1604800 [compost metagenome]
MGDIEPGERHRARNDCSGDGQRGQLAIELAREVAADFLDRFLDHVVVVEQPFGGRRDRRPRFDVGRRRPIHPQDLVFVLAVARTEFEREEARQGRCTLERKGLAALPQLLHREKGRADRIVVIDLLGFRFARRGGRHVMKGHGCWF